VTSRCPLAEWKPLGAQTAPAMAAHDLVVVHTMVGNLMSTDAMFRASGYTGTESTYGLGGKWGGDASRGLDGVLWQWQDRGHQADAQLDANPRAISVETADNAPTSAADIARWTPAQAEALVDLLAWECSLTAHTSCPRSWDCRQGITGSGIRVSIPPVLVADSKAFRRGIAYHRQGIDPWRVAGGEHWSSSRGKECPGDRRINQLTTEIIPAVQARIRGDGMTISSADAKEIWTGPGSDVVEINKWDDSTEPVDAANPTWRPAPVLAWLYRGISELLTRVRATQSQAAYNGSQLSTTSSQLSTVLSRIAAIEQQVASTSTALTTKVDAVAAALDTIAVGGVDHAALAASVADQLAARLQA
jgi:hypothetical protein